MAIQKFIERRHAVQAMQWLHTEQCRADLRELFADQHPQMTIDGSGVMWLALEGHHPVKVSQNYWVIREHDAALVCSPQEFVELYEVVAP